MKRLYQCDKCEAIFKAEWKAAACESRHIGAAVLGEAVRRCPFCHSIEVECGNENRVVCLDCHADGPHGKNDDYAWINWNRRAPQGVNSDE